MNTSRLVVSSLIGLMLFSTISCRHAAKITNFTVSPTSLTAGNSAQLCYELVNAVSARIDPNVGELQDKNKSCLKIEPRQTTDYILTARGDDGKTTITQLTVSVEAPPPLANIVTFEAKRDTTATGPGSLSELCYEVRGATSLSIKPDIGIVEPVDKGCRTVKPNTTTSYELAATGTDNQTVTKQVTVSVVQPPARIVRFDVSPANVKAGEKVHICYQVQDAASAHIANLNYAIKLGPAECIDVQPRRSTTLTLEARNSDGKSVSREARVTVEQLPVEIVDFKSQPAEVEKGKGIVLHYKIVNAARAQITHPGGVLPLPNPEGDVKFTPPTTATFVLTAQDPDGKPTSRSITVQVVPPAQAQFFVRPTNQTINRGDEATLCYGVTWGSKVSVYSELLRTARDLESSEKKCITVRPTSTDTFTLTATGPNGAPVTAQATVTVRVPPPSVRFFARSATQQNTQILISRGDQSELCYALTNVAEATINPGFGRVEVSQGKCLALGELATTTVYTLRAIGTDGTVKTQQVTVQVYPPPEIIRFDGQVSGGRNLLCFQYRYGVRAEIAPQIGQVTSPTGSRCVVVPSPSSASYTLTVYGKGRVAPAVSRFPRR